jgi:hypothetical protein
MSVYQRNDLNEYYGTMPRSQREWLEAARRENERKTRELREREERWWSTHVAYGGKCGGGMSDGVTNLVCIDGVWRVP